MAEITVPSLDFTPLANLGNVYTQARNDATRRQTLAELGSGTGQIDPRQLYASGDLSLAQLGQQIQNHNDQLAQQQWTQQHTLQRDTVDDKFRQAQLAISQRAADRADQTPLDTATQRAAAAQKFGIDPTSPEGKTFVLTGKLPDTTPAANYEPNPDYGKVEGASKLRPISGGPADPETIKADAAAKQGSGLSDAAKQIKARQVINGDLSGLQNIGRGAQAGRTLEDISNTMADILTNEQGMSPQEAAQLVGQRVQAFKASQVGQSAEARTGATREANLNLILRATDAAIPAALEASQKVARTGWVPLNKVIQGGEVVASDPELKRFGMANLQLAEHWARAMNPTGVMRESDRDKALGFLSTADSPQTYAAAVDQLHTQIVRERDAVRGAVPETPQYKGGQSSAPAAPSAPKKTVIDGYTITEH